MAAAAVVCLRFAIVCTSCLRMRLLASTVATDMRRPRFAKGATMRTLRDRSTLLVDMLQWSIRMLAVADTMTPHTCITGILLALDQHFVLDWEGDTMRGISKS